MNLANTIKPLFRATIHAGQLLISWVRTHRSVRIGINLVILAILITFVGQYINRNWNQISQASIRINFQHFLPILLFFAINHILLALAWHLLIKAYCGINPVWSNLEDYSKSLLMRFLPTPIWFLTSRVVLYNLKGAGKGEILAATTMETFLHVLTGAALYGVLLIDPVNPFTFLYGIGIILFVIIIIHPSILELQWLKIWTGKPNFPRRETIILICFYLATWIIALPYFQNIILAITPNNPIPPPELLKVWILSSLIAYIAAYTMGGVGILRELSLTFLLSFYFSPPIAVTITVFSRLVITIAGIVTAGMTIVLAQLVNKVKNNSMEVR